ncbi:MAG: PEP-CTERM sorting domain-containing protein [Phycisphaerales bacterium]|nr:PEP-CTERM sorting domain-containing protein [Phycisphaerales bacterium]
MRRKLDKRGGLATVVAVVAAFGVVASAVASPVITNTILNTRVFNDDPGSTLSTVNSYPSIVQISDTMSASPAGFANLHNYHLGTNPFSEAVFNNGDGYRFEFDLTITGSGQGESGMQIAPWWSQNVDGRFNFRTTDGEIAVFGGRLPFYSFTANHSVTYTKGETARVGVRYVPNQNTQNDPGVIVYYLSLGGNDYSSPPLEFNQANPNEDPPYGLWGTLNDGRVGGYTQVFLSGGAGANLTTTWSNIAYAPEPASLALLAFGAVAVMRRRR